MSDYHVSARAFVLRQTIPNEWLEQILDERLRELSLSRSEWPSTDCLLADMGRFFVRSIDVLCKLAEKTVHGQHINAYTRSKIQEMEELNDFSELNHLDYLDEKRETLKYVISRGTPPWIPS